MYFLGLKLGRAAIRNNLLLMVLPFFCFVLFLFFSHRLVDAESEKISIEHHVERERYATMLKSQVERELNSIIFLTSGISSYFTVYHQTLNDKQVNEILAELHKKAKHTRNFGLAVGYRLKYIYPMHSNEEAVNLDYRELPKQWPHVQKAITTKSGVLEGPVNLVQGGTGLIYSYPIFVDGQYWGMVSSVIDTVSFFKSAFHGVVESKYNFALRLKHIDNQTLIYGNEKSFSQQYALITNSEVPNGELEWAVVSMINQGPAHIVMLKIMSWVISFFLAGTLFFLLKDRQTLVFEAASDSLTGIANRRFINKKISASLKHANSHQKLIAIMFIDLDYFKKINDAYGHDFGDEVLKVVSKTLSRNIRASDTLSRVGGDEFVILLNELDRVEDSVMIANKIIEAFQYPIIVNNRIFKVNLTIGVATSSTTYQEGVKGLMKKADIALYEAKGSGRNKYMVYSDRMR